MNPKLIAKFMDGEKVTTLVETPFGFSVSQNSADRFYSMLFNSYDEAYAFYKNIFKA